MEVVLIRHGEADSNIAPLDREVGAYAELTQKGRLQVEKAAQEIGKLITADCIYASPFPRTLQSAEILAATTNLKVLVDDRLKEINKGEWVGLPVKEVIEKEAQVDVDERHLFRPPGGENWQDVAERVLDFINEHRHLGTEQLVAITHDHCIRMASGSLLGRPIISWEDMEVGHASTTIFSDDDGEWRLRLSIPTPSV